MRTRAAFGDIRKGLQDIEEHCEALLTLLPEHWPLARDFAVSRKLFDLPFGVTGNPLSEHPGAWEWLVNTPQELMHCLSMMAVIAREVEERWPLDKGGGRTLHTLSSGPPEWRLAADCYALFTEHRPGEATGSPPGQQEETGGYIGSRPPCTNWQPAKGPRRKVSGCHSTSAKWRGFTTR